MQQIAKGIVNFLAVAALFATAAAAADIPCFIPNVDLVSFDGCAIPIGGTNPLPTSATLTGNFSPTTLSDTPNLVDGDFGIIHATDGTTPIGIVAWDLIFPGNAGQFDITNLTGSNSLPPDFPMTTLVTFSDLKLVVNFNNGSVETFVAASGAGAVPEPSTSLLLAIGLFSLIIMRSWKGKRMRTTLQKGTSALAMVVLCLVIAQSAFGQVVLIPSTSPGSGVSGVTNVYVTGSHFPAGTITPSNVAVSFATTCGGAAVMTESATSVKNILGSVDRINVAIPAGLVSGNYFVQVADSAVGDANFTSTDCSEVQVTGSAAILNACVAGSSMGVLLPSGGAAGNVTAYVPKGFWGGSTTGVFVKNIEGALGPGTSIPTAHIANSCSSNPATGQTVCVANNTDVYLISGTTLTNTLTSGSNTTTTFSGGTCNNCGVALNAANNTATINMGVTGGASGSGVQILDLNTNTFHPAFPMLRQVSENISVDPTRSLILSADEGGNFVLDQIQGDGSLKEFDSSFSIGGESDSSAEDCSTGIGLSPQEFTNNVTLVNLNGLTLTTSPYTAPHAVATLSTPGYGGFAAGLSGSAVAQGSGHLAVVTGEFGGNTFAVLKLPATAGSGTPALVDYAVAQIPSNAACGGIFSAGFDPHTITAYTSPNTGDSFAVFAGYASGVPICLAVVDMTTVINPALSPRGGGVFGANEISPANLPASAVTFFSLP
jgi:hypothetical protein